MSSMLRRWIPFFGHHSSAPVEAAKASEEPIEQQEDHKNSEADPPSNDSVSNGSQKRTSSRKKQQSRSFKRSLTKLIKTEQHHHHHHGASNAGAASSVSNTLEDDHGNLEALEDTVEIIQLSERQKHLIRTTWNTVSGELAQSLSYVGGSGKHNTEEIAANQPRNEGEIVTEPFLKLFEEYPMSQQFFVDFRGTPVESLRNDQQLAIKLQEHAIRVLRVVEKVIGRLEDLEKSKRYLLDLGRFHRHVGIPSDYLGVMGSIFVHAVRPYLVKHQQWNEETEDAWQELFGHITRVMTHAHINYQPAGSQKI